ncbi:protease [Baekduia alba]|uniref:S8 family peptidase n=1 Tax=Baekduia alba TaxID=2997333 RepID=UPI0023404591|nr:S8 family serine peptidase [Baekduia alba]WCB95532.1 protease [Baekduia alba]
MRRPVAIALTVATVGAGVTSAGVRSPLAEEAAGAWSPALPAAGYCVPAPDDGLLVPRAVGALAAPSGPTRPIAILDTGVDPGVGQLAGRVLQGWDALTGAPVSGDGDGHGTEAAGLAASAGPGMLGVAPASPILPIRIYDPATRTASPAAIAKGIALAVAKGAGVVVVEGSAPRGGVGDDDVRMLSSAVDAAFVRGVLTVAGAGDDTADGTAPALPASLPHVLVAGSATPSGGARSAPTNTGPWLDLLVPGEGVTAPLPGALCANGYGFSGGTSFAAPSLGAAVAVVQAARPGLTTQQLFEVMRRAGTDLGVGGRDDDSGFGLLSMALALSAAPLAKETSAEIDDDPFWVRGSPYAKAHPALLTRTKLRFKAKGTVSPAKDPADVYRVSLSKRERMVVSVGAASPNALLELSVLDPRVGDFDVTDDVSDYALVATGGFSNDPQVEWTATRSGIYSIAVQAADPVDPNDPGASVPDLEPYTLSAYKQRRDTRAKR